MPGPGGVWSQGVGVPALGGGVPSLGVPGLGRVWSQRGCLMETPPQTATAADGTHPTGMHSFFALNFYRSGFEISDSLVYDTKNFNCSMKPKQQPKYWQPVYRLHQKVLTLL